VPTPRRSAARATRWVAQPRSSGGAWARSADVDLFCDALASMVRDGPALAYARDPATGDFAPAEDARVLPRIELPPSSPPPCVEPPTSAPTGHYRVVRCAAHSASDRRNSSGVRKLPSALRSIGSSARFDLAMAMAISLARRGSEYRSDISR
jgi:hypothetical protein